ncbi:efflux RND transporter periplasmic adaptor subunit [Taibaiella lutea]|uniref:Efflux RND transporter periplasmic adaptor subunit n=1 Tax=Taibaiella lutea TaxID=2608001 RepID=A0A5M6CII7_9BACT|nr:efflux RND transporter periplasmic adaptor subunit [Taibaiella lutea]KAA5534836.1 efflux RND transporter periplasmic adaptor subunit [Taibaiella lutea]
MKRLSNIALSLTSIAALASCGGKEAPKAPPPTSVSVAEVTEGDAVYLEDFPGTVTALNQVEIRPQVAGYITAIHFQDGQQVKKGQLLYTIDQQAYQSNVNQAQANVAVAQANLNKAQKDADRYTALDKKDAIAKQILDHALADLESSKMQVKAAQATVNSLQTNLKYASIYAPFDGTIGISQVKVGTSVYQQSLLNTVSSDDPMAVDIAIDQTKIARFISYLGKDKEVEQDSIFTLKMPDGSVYPSSGHLALLDRSVDPNTGTLKARLVFPNGQKNLKAGITCNVLVKHNNTDKSLLIPNKAIVQQLGENFVFVVFNGKQVSERKVVLGNKADENIVVLSGLEKGETVVTDGVQKLKDSSFVQIGPAPAAPAK